MCVSKVVTTISKGRIVPRDINLHLYLSNPYRAFCPYYMHTWLWWFISIKYLWFPVKGLLIFYSYIHTYALYIYIYFLMNIENNLWLYNDVKIDFPSGVKHTYIDNFVYLPNVSWAHSQLTPTWHRN